MSNTNNEKSILPESQTIEEKTLLAIDQQPLVDVPIPTKEEEQEYTQLRAKAQKVAEESPKPKIKAKIIRKITKASAFGATHEEASVEREVVQTPVDEKSEAIKAELDKQLTDPIMPSAAALTSGVQAGGMNQLNVPPEKIEEVKALRDELSSLWSTAADKNQGKEFDHLIDGCDTGEHTAVVNPDSGDSGVRIKFKGKNK